MIAWINIVILLASTLLTLIFYIKSVSPAALEKKIGAIAYQKCAQSRLISGIMMLIASANYILYVFYPLPLSLPKTFPWSWWISILIAIGIAIPAGLLWYRGIHDAGKETMTPSKDHTLYKGIYLKIRHPQALGELPYWWVFAFLCHSPFLTLYSFVWIPIFYEMCMAEERDLAVRYGQPYLDYKQQTGAFFPKKYQPRYTMRIFLGLFSLACVAAALVLAVKILFSFDFRIGTIYLVLIAVSSIMIVLSFCTKCSSKRNCAHVFPGLAARLFKDRRPGEYTKSEMMRLVTGLILILGFPQFWLTRDWKLFFCFWILNGIGLVIIVKNICTGCENRFCPFNKAKKIN